MAPVSNNASLSSGKKKLRVSKNRKKTWIKHTDINDIEEYLVEKRQEERIGGPVSEKPDEALFFVHKEKSEGPVRRRNKHKSLELLRCNQALLPTSQVPPPVKVRYTHPPGYRRHTRSWGQQDLTSKKLWQQRLKNSQKARKQSLKKREIKEDPVTHNGVYDLWNDENCNDKNKSENAGLLDSDLLHYQEEMTQKRPPKVPCHRYQKPSLLPSVEVCSPGASYNPSFEDHQELLNEALEVELKKEKEINRLERTLTEKFPTKDKAPTEETWIAEMSQGLFDEEPRLDEKRANKGICEDVLGNPPVRGDDRKPKAKKKRELEQIRKHRESKMKKLERIRSNQIYKLQAIKKEISAQEQKSLERQSKRSERKIERMYQPHTLSKHKYEAPDIELHLSDELTGELRTLKVEGNVLEDRYKSLQRRNMIECRIKQKKKRKYKLKVFVKRGHRNFQ